MARGRGGEGGEKEDFATERPDGSGITGNNGRGEWKNRGGGGGKGKGGRKNNGDKGGTLFPRFKEKFKWVSCHWGKEAFLVNEGERKM